MTTSNILTRENVLSESRIKLCDQDENLELYSYTSCESEDPELIKRSRGVIFDNNTKKLVLSSFPYTEELKETENSKIKKELQNFNSLKFFPSYEGCVIRVFYYANKWYISTTRKLDAYKSKWASRFSFGYLFEQALKDRIKNTDNSEPVEWLTSQLDKTLQYTFLLTNNLDNRIVCKYDSPEIYHVGTFKDNILIEDGAPVLSIGAPEALSFESPESLIEYVSKVDIFRSQGVVVFLPGNRQLKIINSEYQRLYELRGNEPSLRYRYLQIRMDPEKNREFRMLYSNSEDQFDEYENLIFDTCMYIYKSYVNRYIRSTHVVVPVEEFQVMKEAHEYYKKDPKTNKVRYSTILDILNSQPATRLNKIIRRIKFSAFTDQNKDKTETEHKRLLWDNVKEISCV